MFRIAIVEDDENVRSQLQDYLHRYEEESGERFCISAFSDGDEIVSDYTAAYDIIFLDIMMERLDGMSAAQRIRDMDAEVILIFITNMSNYAIKGYSVGAFDYVLKPVPYFAFSQQLKRAVGQLKKSSASYVTVPVEGGMMRLSVNDIFYIESSGHRLTLYTENDAYSFFDTMRNMEEQLSPHGFFRCNNGYLVNLERVTGVRQNIAIVGEREILISRPRKKAFMDALVNVIGGRAK